MNNETPENLAKALARYLPTKAALFLDPAVGSGTLVQAAVRRIASTASRIVCIDTNPALLGVIKSRVPPSWHGSLDILEGDFLSPTLQTRLRRAYAKIDCIFMNPPFFGRKEYSFAVQANAEPEAVSRLKHVPVEAAFLIKAIDLVKDGGRIVSILPSSVVAGGTLRWLRSMMFRTGKISRVHELPRNIFGTCLAHRTLSRLDPRPLIR